MIKAIETQYKGYRFRSRLEARWAVFFDALGVKWEYEKEGYDLGDAGWYLPDFFCSSANFSGYSNGGVWFEIKPCVPSSVELLKVEKLALLTNCHARLIVGPPSPDTAWYNYNRLGQNDHSDSFNCIGLLVHDIDHEYYNLDNAINAARSARFEHGEKPNINGKRTRKPIWVNVPKF